MACNCGKNRLGQAQAQRLTAAGQQRLLSRVRRVTPGQPAEVEEPTPEAETVEPVVQLPPVVRILR